jgi:hypothetical protein
VSTDEAIEIVAQGIAAAAVLDASTDSDWGGYPDIGEHDWGRVMDRVEEMSLELDPTGALFDEAYALLGKRAKDVES